MKETPLVFAQLLSHFPTHLLRRAVIRYRGNFKVKGFTCHNQFVAMLFAQLTHRESLRDIEACIHAHRKKLYHVGLRSRVSRNNLSNVNKVRDWRIYAEVTHGLIRIARDLYHDDPLELDLNNLVYAIDSTTIDLCLTLFPWALFRRTKSAIKVHTMLDLHGNIPSFIDITHAKISDHHILDHLTLEPGAFYIMDRGYTDFLRLYRFTTAGAFFVIRAKQDLSYRRRYSHPVDKTIGLRSDQTIMLTGPKSSVRYPAPLRRIHYVDQQQDLDLVLLTNNFDLPAWTVVEAYRHRWQIELFFKWIKQHLRIRSFVGTSPNAVKTQIWIAITTYVLVAIVKKRLGIEQSLYTILQILSISLFEKTPIKSLFDAPDSHDENTDHANQLILFE